MTRPGAPFDPLREEQYYVAGDKPIANPIEQGKLGAGYASTLRLDKNKTEVQVRYKDFLITADLYRVKVGEQTTIRLLLLCPRCRNALTIESTKKAISYDDSSMKEAGGQLSVEPFTCTWELDPAKEGRRMEFGLGLCNWRVAIDKNIAKDA